VRDHGVGIDAKNIGEIGAYKQFDRNRLEQQGSGLGLAIARQMLELYGGRFAIKSKVGVGTTVTIELPRVAHHWRPFQEHFRRRNCHSRSS
jgi:two-component system sensor histidine kinase/response regulator